MAHLVTAKRGQRSASARVIRLDIREALDIDPVRTSELFNSFGEQGARGLIEDTLADLDESAARLAGALHAGRIGDIADIAAEIGVVAASMGFWSCARVAGDIGQCASLARTEHIPAIAGRLMRVLAAARNVDWGNPARPG